MFQDESNPEFVNIQTAAYHCHLQKERTSYDTLRPHAWLVPIAPSVLLGAARLFVLGISKGATDSEITIHAWNSHNRLHLTIQYWYALVASRGTITIFTENCFFRMLQFRQCAQCAPLQPCQDTSKKQSKAAVKGADRASREWVSC